MEQQTVPTLHVEDDRFQQRMVAQLLKSAAPDRAFAIDYAFSEEDALRVFTPGRFQLVVLDYELEQGNGLSCLRRIRERDAVVPVIALSATASAELASALVQAGADDFLPKDKLNAKALGQRVCAALERAEALRRRLAVGRPEPWETLLAGVLKTTTTRLGPDWLQLLDQLEAALRRANPNDEAIERQVEAYCLSSERAGGLPAEDTRRLARPVVLEMLVRLQGEESPSNDIGHSQ